jgi:hypothetical protein
VEIGREPGGLFEAYQAFGASSWLEKWLGVGKQQAGIEPTSFALEVQCTTTVLLLFLGFFIQYERFINFAFFLKIILDH